MNFRDYLKNHIVIMDGAMGTYFDTLTTNPSAIAEEANLSDPDLIRSIHKMYLDSGARLIRTNTFAINHSLAISKGLEDATAQDQYLRELIKAAWNIACEAVKDSGHPAWIAADIGPIAESFLFSESDLDEAAEYRFLADCFLDCGAEIFNFETQSDIHTVLQTAAYIRQQKPDAFIAVSFSINRNGYTTKGLSIKRLFADAAKSDDIDSYGCNCLIGAGHMHELLKAQNFSADKYIQILPNSGYPQILRGRTIYSDGVAWFAEQLERIAHMGVNILGGCCGTTPKHIRALNDLLKEHAPYERRQIEGSTVEVEVSKTRNNLFMQKLEAGKTVIAVELDPPFDQNAEKLLEGAFQLKDHNVDIITLADSPLARARADSVLLASKVSSLVDIPVMPHIACRDRNRISMHSTLLGAHINNIRNLMIVTGDPVPSGDRGNTKGVFDFNSIRFMEYVKALNEEVFHQDALSYGGALNQNQANLDKVIERMQRKIDAGASWFLTQPIYSDEDIERIRIMKERLDTKILCGIMPLVSYRNAQFIHNEMPGICVPDEVISKYRPDMSRTEAEEVACAISLSVIRKLQGIADGFYFMTPFNRVSLICRIIDALPEESI